MATGLAAASSAGSERRQQQEQPAAFGQAGRHDQGDHARIAPGRNALGLLQDHALAEQEEQPDAAAAASASGYVEPQRGERQRKQHAGDPGFARHPGALRLAQHVHEAQRPADLEHQQAEAAGDDARARRAPAAAAECRRSSAIAATPNKPGAGAAAQEIAGRLPIPMLLMPGLDPARARCARPAPSDSAGVMSAAGAAAALS